MKKITVFVVVLVLLVSMLAACGQPAATETDAPGAAEVPAPSESAAGAAEVPAPPESSDAVGDPVENAGQGEKMVTSDEPLIIFSDPADLAPSPNGDVAASVKDLDMTDEQIARTKEGGYTCAMITGGSGDGWNAFREGVRDECEKLGIEMVFEAESNYDTAKQATDVETAMALDPDILITLPVDPVAGAQAYQPAVDAGVKIVFLGNGVDGYTAGEEYVTLISGDYYGMGGTPAHLISEAIGGSGDIGMIFYDVNFYTTNMRDAKFEEVIAEEYPDINIVSKQGFSVESETAEPTSVMMLQHPEIKAIYVSWDVAAENVLAELRSIGREDVRVVSVDLGDTNDLDMAQNGIMYGKTAEPINPEGGAMVRAAALDLIGEEVGPYYVSGYLVVTRENLWKSYELAEGKPLPENIQEALQDPQYDD